MKIKGGYLPRITGRPSKIIEDIPVPEKLYISLKRRGMEYTSIVEDSQNVKFGQALAEKQIEGGKLTLPSPATGKIYINQEASKNSCIILIPEGDPTPIKVCETSKLNYINEVEIRSTLANSGIWPFFWSSKTNGVPPLNIKKPKAIVVTFVHVEPFRARGDVILQKNWKTVMDGIKFLDKLVADYGTIEIVIPDTQHPIIPTIYKELAGFAWVKFHNVPLIYPADNNLLLSKMIKKNSSSIKKEDDIWIIDIQGVESIGTCLSEGVPLFQRMISVGGPGIKNPRHLITRIGTPLGKLFKESDVFKENLVLRGGLLLGEPINPGIDAVTYDDDAFFFLPKFKKREFLSFLRPGFDRTSYLPVFGTALTHKTDSQITNSLRGEIRPCISCGICEVVCPVGLLPQVLHKYLYAGELDEAEKLGLNLCIDCNLCTYICPSKIELQKQFMEARIKLKAEREEASRILAQRGVDV